MRWILPRWIQQLADLLYMRHRKVSSLSMQFDLQHSVHYLQNLRGWIISGHRMRCLVRRRVSSVRLGVDLLHHDQRGRLRIVHDVRLWQLHLHCMHDHLQRRVPNLPRWQLLSKPCKPQPNRLRHGQHLPCWVNEPDPLPGGLILPQHRDANPLLRWHVLRRGVHSVVDLPCRVLLPDPGHTDQLPRRKRLRRREHHARHMPGQSVLPRRSGHCPTVHHMPGRLVRGGGLHVWPRHSVPVPAGDVQPLGRVHPVLGNLRLRRRSLHPSRRLGLLQCRDLLCGRRIHSVSDVRLGHIQQHRECHSMHTVCGWAQQSEWVGRVLGIVSNRRTTICIRDRRRLADEEN